MANPQTDNGYTQIANEVLEALVNSGLNGTELAVVLHVIRKTYGFKKKEDLISLSQFMKVIPVSRISIYYALKNLQLVKIIKLVKKGNSKNMANLYAFNKNYEEWQLVKKTKLVKKTYTTSKENLTKLVKKVEPTKETITKETIQKKIYIATSFLSKQLNHDFDLLRITEDEYAKLGKKFGSRLPSILIDFENSLGAKGYKYKSHYRAILKWYDKPKDEAFYKKEYEALGYNDAAFIKRHGTEALLKILSYYQ